MVFLSLLVRLPFFLSAFPIPASSTPLVGTGDPDSTCNLSPRDLVLTRDTSPHHSERLTVPSGTRPPRTVFEWDVCDSLWTGLPARPFDIGDVDRPLDGALRDTVSCRLRFHRDLPRGRFGGVPRRVPAYDRCDGHSLLGTSPPVLSSFLFEEGLHRKGVGEDCFEL